MKKTIILLILLVIPLSLFAFDKVGTTAAQFLQIGVGGRITALSGAGTALVSGPEALYWNPSGIINGKGISLSAYYANWFAGLKHQFVGVTIPVSEDAVVGASILSLAGDDFEQTTLSFQEGNGVMVEYGDYALSASYGRRLTDRFVFGSSIKYIHQKMFHETASSIAFDIGTQLITDLTGFNIGMALTNLGPEMKLSGRDLLTSGVDETAQEYQMSSWPLPMTFATGASWRLLGSDVAFHKTGSHGLTIIADGRHLNEGLTFWKTGVEYDYRNTLFLRSGKTFGHDSEDLSFGAGIRLQTGKYNIFFDFAFADLGDLGAVQRFSVSLK